MPSYSAPPSSAGSPASSPYNSTHASHSLRTSLSHDGVSSVNVEEPNPGLTSIGPTINMFQQLNDKLMAELREKDREIDALRRRVSELECEGGGAVTSNHGIRNGHPNSTTAEPPVQASLPSTSKIAASSIGSSILSALSSSSAAAASAAAPQPPSNTKSVTFDTPPSAFENSESREQARSSSNTSVASDVAPTLQPLNPSSLNSATLNLLTAAGKSIEPPMKNDASPTKRLPPAPPDPHHATDFASIRRRYTSLEKGPDAEAELIFPTHHTLFTQTFEVDWVEDSPGFRHKLAAIDENVEGLRRHMLRLVDICRRYCEAGTAFSEVGRTFASEMMHLNGDPWFTRLGDLAPALVRFGETLDEIQSYRDALLISLETTFSAPMEAFVKREVKEVKKKRQEMRTSMEEYEANLMKLGTLKNNAESEVVADREAAVAASKRRYELVRFDLVNLLNQLEIKKKFQLVERICSGLYANLGFFHQCHTLVAIREPSMRELQGQLQDAKKEYYKTERLWSAKRTQLELELSTGFFPRPRNPSQDLMHSRVASFVQSSDGSLEDAAEARKKALSSPPRLSDFEASIGIVKHGFLWKRSSNVKRDWKRRWFIIQGGKLKYIRQEEIAVVSPPVTVCDIMLCTVRECNKPGDARFTFEIVSPNNRTYTCRAESHGDYKEWVAAIREQTESMLVKGMAHETLEGERSGQGGNRTGGSTQPAGVSSLGIPDRAVVLDIMRANQTCVDCGNEDPDWISINMGTLLCIQCSGIHRSMGVHVSKVRSMTLDNWSLPMLGVLQLAGNEVANKVWEGKGGAGKPGAGADRDESEKYIRAKYISKDFLEVVEAKGGRLFGGDTQSVDQKLWAAAGKSDVVEVLRLIALGADVNFRKDGPKGVKDVSVLHSCVIGGGQKQLECLEVLLVNGANLDVMDSEETGVLDAAVDRGRVEVIAFLVAKFEGTC